MIQKHYDGGVLAGGNSFPFFKYLRRRLIFFFPKSDWIAYIASISLLDIWDVTLWQKIMKKPIFLDLSLQQMKDYVYREICPSLGK